MLFGLSADVNLNSLEEDIVSLLSEEGNSTTFPALASPEYKLRVTVHTFMTLSSHNVFSFPST